MSEAAPNAPSGGIAERVVRGLAAMSLVTVVGYLGQLIVVPVGMHAWGPVRYGEWVSLSALVAFMAMSDLGIQSHVVNRMCAHDARGEHDKFLSELHSALRLQGPLALGIWIVFALVTFFLPLDVWLGVHTATRVETYLAVCLLCAELLLGVPLGALRGVYRATGQIARAGVLTAIKRAVELLMPALFMLAGARFPTLALARVIFAVGFDLLVIQDLRRQHSWFRLRPLSGSAAAGLAMLAPGVLFLVAGLGEYLANQGNLLVVQSILGGEEVSRFSTHRTIANMGRMLSVQITSVIWPELTALDALNDAAQLIRAHRTTAKLVGFVVGASLLGFLPVAEPLYSAWTLRKLSIDMPTLAMFVAQTSLWGVWGVSATALLATNRQGRLALILSVNAFVVFLLSAVLVPRYGMRGASLAVLVSDICVAAWAIPRAACAALGDQLGSFSKEIGLALGIGLGIPASLSAFVYRMLPAGFWRLILTPPLFFMLALGFFWIALMPAERGSARRLFVKIRQKLRGMRPVAL